MRRIDCIHCVPGGHRGWEGPDDNKRCHVCGGDGYVGFKTMAGLDRLAVDVVKIEPALGERPQ